ncbi:hypothetical protein CDAR_316971 [Caerostris darwini]|uniref:Uncharacterized protein n=1 Tax=Caerostris darwini TaxID=1538125 RepID=A0AAV4Q9P6_9ARAC|nr:hypothetical protein CDAR_316971 [Caerostris darwini]
MGGQELLITKVSLLLMTKVIFICLLLFLPLSFGNVYEDPPEVDEDLKSGRSRDTRVLRRKDGVSRRSPEWKTGLVSWMAERAEGEEAGERRKRHRIQKRSSHHENRRDVEDNVGKRARKSKSKSEPRKGGRNEHGRKRSQRGNSKRTQKAKRKKKLRKFPAHKEVCYCEPEGVQRALEGKDTAICICGPKEGQWRKEYRKKLKENKEKQSSTSSPNIGIGTTPSKETKQVESKSSTTEERTETSREAGGTDDEMELVKRESVDRDSEMVDEKNKSSVENWEIVEEEEDSGPNVDLKKKGSKKKPRLKKNNTFMSERKSKTVKGGHTRENDRGPKFGRRALVLEKRRNRGRNNPLISGRRQGRNCPHGRGRNNLQFLSRRAGRNYPHVRGRRHGRNYPHVRGRRHGRNYPHVRGRRHGRNYPHVRGRRHGRNYPHVRGRRHGRNYPHVRGRRHRRNYPRVHVRRTVTPTYFKYSVPVGRRHPDIRGKKRKIKMWDSDINDGKYPGMIGKEKLGGIRRRYVNYPDATESISDLWGDTDYEDDLDIPYVRGEEITPPIGRRRRGRLYPSRRITYTGDDVHDERDYPGRNRILLPEKYEKEHRFYPDVRKTWFDEVDYPNKRSRKRMRKGHPNIKKKRGRLPQKVTIRNVQRIKDTWDSPENHHEKRRRLPPRKRKIRDRLHPADEIGKPRKTNAWDDEFDYPEEVRRTVIPSRRHRPKGHLHPGRFRDIVYETEIKRGRRYPNRILPFGKPPKRRGLYTEENIGKPRRTKEWDDDCDYPEVVRRTVIPSRKHRSRGRLHPGRFRDKGDETEIERGRRYQNRILPFGKPPKGRKLYTEENIGKPRRTKAWDEDFDYPDAVRRTVIPSRRHRPRRRLHPGRFSYIVDETEIERGRHYPNRILPFGKPPKRRKLYTEEYIGKPRRTTASDDEFDYLEVVRRTVIPSRRHRPRGHLHPGRFRDIEDETETERGRHYPNSILPFGKPPKRRRLYTEENLGKPRISKAWDDEFDLPDTRIRKRMHPRVGRNRPFHPRGRIESIDEIADSGNGNERERQYPSRRGIFPSQILKKKILLHPKWKRPRRSWTVNDEFDYPDTRRRKRVKSTGIRPWRRLPPNIRGRIAGTKHDVFPSEKRSRLYPDDKIGKPRSQETWDYDFDYPDIRQRARIPSERQRPKGRLHPSIGESIVEFEKFRDYPGRRRIFPSWKPKKYVTWRPRVRIGKPRRTMAWDEDFVYPGRKRIPSTGRRPRGRLHPNIRRNTTNMRDIEFEKLRDYLGRRRTGELERMERIPNERIGELKHARRWDEDFDYPDTMILKGIPFRRRLQPNMRGTMRCQVQDTVCGTMFPSRKLNNRLYPNERVGGEIMLERKKRLYPSMRERVVGRGDDFIEPDKVRRLFVPGTRLYPDKGKRTQMWNEYFALPDALGKKRVTLDERRRLPPNVRRKIGRPFGVIADERDRHFPERRWSLIPKALRNGIGIYPDGRTRTQTWDEDFGPLDSGRKRILLEKRKRRFHPSVDGRIIQKDKVYPGRQKSLTPWALAFESRLPPNGKKTFDIEFVYPGIAGGRRTRLYPSIGGRSTDVWGDIIPRRDRYTGGRRILLPRPIRRLERILALEKGRNRNRVQTWGKKFVYPDVGGRSTYVWGDIKPKRGRLPGGRRSSYGWGDMKPKRDRHSEGGRNTYVWGDIKPKRDRHSGGRRSTPVWGDIKPKRDRHSGGRSSTHLSGYMKPNRDRHSGGRRPHVWGDIKPKRDRHSGGRRSTHVWGDIKPKRDKHAGGRRSTYVWGDIKPKIDRLPGGRSSTYVWSDIIPKINRLPGGISSSYLWGDMKPKIDRLPDGKRSTYVWSDIIPKIDRLPGGISSSYLWGDMKPKIDRLPDGKRSTYVWSDIIPKIDRLPGGISSSYLWGDIKSKIDRLPGGRRSTYVWGDIKPEIDRIPGGIRNTYVWGDIKPKIDRLPRRRRSPYIWSDITPKISRNPGGITIHEASKSRKEGRLRTKRQANHGDFDRAILIIETRRRRGIPREERARRTPRDKRDTLDAFKNTDYGNPASVSKKKGI